MPRIRALTAREQKNIELQAVIDKYMRLNGVENYSALGKRIGKSSSTACRRINNLDKIELGEIRALVKSLRIPNEEISKLLI